MILYEIVAEAHEGAFSVDEEVLGTVAANSPEEAIIAFADKDVRLSWVRSWNCWVIGELRKVFAREAL